MEDNLHIYEKVFLLALRDKEGTVFSSVNYRHAVAGAMLAELMLRKFVSVEVKGKRKFLKLENQKSTGDEMLDECMLKIKKAKRRASLQTWVHRFTSIKGLKNRTARQLCRKGILNEKEKKVLFIFKQNIYPEVNPKPEKALLEKMEKAIFGTSKNFEPELVILISLCDAVHLLEKIFDRKKVKAQKKRIKAITSGEIVGKATQEAIEAMQAAIMVTTVIPAITTATTT